MSCITSARSSTSATTRSCDSSSSGCLASISTTIWPCHEASREKVCPSMRVIARSWSSSIGRGRHEPAHECDRLDVAVGEHDLVVADAREAQRPPQPPAGLELDPGALGDLGRGCTSARPPSSSCSARSTSAGTSRPSGSLRVGRVQPPRSCQVVWTMSTSMPAAARRRAAPSRGSVRRCCSARGCRRRAGPRSALRATDAQRLGRLALDRARVDVLRAARLRRGRARCAACPRPEPNRRPGTPRRRARRGHARSRAPRPGSTRRR